jgi:hypothetical protein
LFSGQEEGWGGRENGWFQSQEINLSPTWSPFRPAYLLMETQWGRGGGGLGTASCLPRTREKTSQGWAHAVLWTLEAHPRSFLWLFPSIVSPVPPTAAGHQAPWSQSHLILLPDHHRLLWPGL